MRLLVDGRPYRGAKGMRRFDEGKLGEQLASWDVDLYPGKHEIAVQVESTVSKAVSREVVIDRKGGNPDELPNLYVLSIGVSAYPGRLRLKYAAADADAVAEVFRETSKEVFRKVEVKKLTDKQATRQGFLDGLEWLKEKMTAKDVAVIFFAGHGGKDRNGHFICYRWMQRHSTFPGPAFQAVS